MKYSLQSYRESRDTFLTQITEGLFADERFTAAWLTGSYGRDQADEVSDLDLSVVVAAPYSESLCARQEQVSPKTTPARFAIFRTFGKPALIHENNNNAPAGGTFTFVLYSGSGIMIDWVLIPQSNAKRPFESLLLFEKAEIPVSSSSSSDLAESKESVAERWAFFWMMIAITVKYIIRNDDVFVTQWLENLHRLIHELERQLHHQPRQYTRGSMSRLQPTREKQIESIRALSERMRMLAPEVERFTGMSLSLPLGEIETLLTLATEEYARN